MNIKNFVTTLDNIPKKADAVEKITESYSTKMLPGDVEKLLSASRSGIFFDEGCRLLSLEDIVSASGDLNVDFLSACIIPLIDTGDNNYIVYNHKFNNWSIFNIVDESSFCTKNSLIEILDSIYGENPPVGFSLSNEKIQTVADILSQYAPEAWLTVSLDMVVGNDAPTFDAMAVSEDDTQYQVSIDDEDQEKLMGILLDDMKKNGCRCFHFELTSDGNFNIDFA